MINSVSSSRRRENYRNDRSPHTKPILQVGRIFYFLWHPLGKNRNRARARLELSFPFRGRLEQRQDQCKHCLLLDLIWRKTKDELVTFKLKLIAWRTCYWSGCGTGTRVPANGCKGSWRRLRSWWVTSLWGFGLCSWRQSGRWLLSMTTTATASLVFQKIKARFNQGKPVHWRFDIPKFAIFKPS